MRKNVDREGPIQLAILKYLRTQYPSAAIHASPNSNTMKGQNVARLIAKNKMMGMRPGWPDIEMIHKGRFIAFEVKAEGNKQQDNQKAVEADIDAAGGYYFVVRSIADVEEVMAEIGPPVVTIIPVRGVVT